ncbi:MAG: DUF4330 domain-containing protein [Bacillota bacterium]|nr:DUF4330 domain-containing protein [Bacillota bacterium]
MLDKKGRLFGKISVVDLAIIIILLAVAARFAYAELGARVGRSIAEREHTIEVTFLVPAIRPTTVDAIRQSKAVFEFKTGAYVGDVVKVETEPADVLLLLGQEVWAQVQSPNRVNALVTVRGRARIGENVITMGGVEIRVGASVGLKSKWAAFQSNVLTINTEVAGEQP